MKINQLNGRDVDNCYKELSLRVNACIGKIDYKGYSRTMVNRLLDSTAIDISAKKESFQEGRRILWTTYTNISMWFDNWEADLVNLGFATVDSDGRVYIPDKQLKRIINLDETCLCFDGNNGNRGGRPSATFYNPHLPSVGKTALKGGKTTTLITGSSAWGEPIPPHFQFQTAATNPDNMRINNCTMEYMVSISAEHGSGNTEQTWPCSLGMNEKGGMDESEFEKYILGSIVPLFPDASDVPGRRVMLKVDSGPGRTNRDLLATLRHLGFYMYPGVPNTTAVTQETDKSYGPFKSQFRTNLDTIVQRRIKLGKSLSLSPWMVGLVVFGGLDSETGYEIKQNDSAFEVAFSVEACKKAWAEVGAAPLTRRCLTDSKVRRELGDAEDTLNELMSSIQEGNDAATALLIRHGLDGAQLRVQLKRKRQGVTRVTLPNTLDRQKLLAKASTHGEKFTATGGTHLTSDDFFKAMEINLREKEVVSMKADRQKRLDSEAAHMAAKSILCMAKGPQSYTAKELTVLLKWYNVPMKEVTSKALKMAKWQAIMVSLADPPSYDVWTNADEEKLIELSNMDVSMADTSLGRLRERKKRELFASVATMTDEERDALRAEMDAVNPSQPAEPPADSLPPLPASPDIADAAASLVGLGGGIPIAEC